MKQVRRIFWKILLKRSPNQYEAYANIVDQIIKDVRNNGDKALFSYT